MFTQIFNNELYYMFSTIELVSFVLAAAILIIAFVLFVGITKPVSIPYMQAWLSKAKYLAVYLDKTHRVQFKAANMKSNVIKASGLPASAFVKKDNHGSYTLGSLKADIMTGDVAHVYDDKYARALEVLKRLGITDELDACALCTAYLAEKEGIETDCGQIIDRLANVPTEADFKVLIPVYSQVYLTELGNWIKLTPENIESWKDGEVDEVKRKLLRKDGTVKGGLGFGNIGMIAAAGIGLLILVMAFMSMGGGA